MATDTWKQMSDDEKSRINPFDYERTFPKVIKQGGFDAVIGNPPYGYMIEELDQAHYRSIYVHQDYQLDNYQLFLEKCPASLIRTPGRFGMIIPNPWLTNLRQHSLRAFVVQQCAIEEIVHFSFPVFSAAVVDTEVVILSKPLAPRNTATAVFVDDPSQLLYGTTKKVPHNQDVWLENPGDVINLSVDALSGSLAAKLRGKTNRRVEEIVALNVGIKPYQVGKGIPPQTRETVTNRPFDSKRKIDKTYRPCLRGRDITRFSVVPTELRYLSYGPWLAEPRPAANSDAPKKILMRQTGDSLIAAIDDEQRVCMNNTHVVVPIDKKWPMNLIPGILNSKLLNWYYQTVNPERGEALAEIKRTHIAQLPLPDSSDAPLSKKIASAVAIMPALHKRRTTDSHPRRREQLQREIDATDRQIDKLVYELYGLSDDEIRMVEEATK